MGPTTIMNVQCNPHSQAYVTLSNYFDTKLMKKCSRRKVCNRYPDATNYRHPVIGVEIMKPLPITETYCSEFVGKYAQQINVL